MIFIEKEIIKLFIFNINYEEMQFLMKRYFNFNYEGYCMTMWGWQFF
jgi:hypothetical protein